MEDVERCQRGEKMIEQAEIQHWRKLAEHNQCNAVASLVEESLDLQMNSRRLKSFDEMRIDIYSYFEYRKDNLIESG